MIPLKGRRIALIGGGGFIGHNLALELSKREADVCIIDSFYVNNLLHFTATDKDFPERHLYLKFIQQRLDLLSNAHIPVYIEDARNYHALTHVLDKIKPRVVIFLTAVAHADRSNKDPYSTFDHSLRTLENALDNTRSSVSCVEHFIFFSSSMVYGHFPSGYVTEDTSCDPLGIYGALKFSGEKIVKAYNQVFNLPYTIVRPSALYGQRCVSRRVIQIFIENAISGMDININGDGSDRLDFTYIKDLISGIINVVENENSKGQIFNLTYGESRSIGEVAEIIKSYFPDIKVNYLPKDKLIPDRGTLSVEKARNLIGYNPHYPLEKGLEEYIKWYKTFQ